MSRGSHKAYACGHVCGPLDLSDDAAAGAHGPLHRAHEGEGRPHPLEVPGESEEIRTY